MKISQFIFVANIVLRCLGSPRHIEPLGHEPPFGYVGTYVSLLASSSFWQARVTRLTHSWRISNGLESSPSRPPENKARVELRSNLVPFWNSASIFLFISAEISLFSWLWRYPFRCSHRSQAVCHNLRINALSHLLDDWLVQVLDNWVSWAVRHWRTTNPSKKFPHPNLYCFMVTDWIIVVRSPPWQGERGKGRET